MHTFWGWAHETGVNPGDWSCYVGAKLNAANESSKTHNIKNSKNKKLEA